MSGGQDMMRSVKWNLSQIKKSKGFKNQKRGQIKVDRNLNRGDFSADQILKTKLRLKNETRRNNLIKLSVFGTAMLVIITFIILINMRVFG